MFPQFTILRASKVFYRVAPVVLLSATFSAAQPSAMSQYRDPAELVRKAVKNEMAESGPASAHFMFRGTKTTPKGSATRLYVETSEATAGRVIAYNGIPLTPEQTRSEQARLNRFLNNPDEIRKKQAQERNDAERTMKIVRALPDAFVYEYAGEELGSAGIGSVGEPLVKLTFRPNPKYQPPSRVEEVLLGMQGYLLLDPSRARLASIDATLFKDVSFGWGILGHLDKGGHFLVHQQAVENNLWEISRMSLKFTGKILLFKGLSIESTEVFSDFKRVASNLTFAQGVELLAQEAKSNEQNGKMAGQTRQHR